jgi:glycine cleavage system aminomethyltransferase T
VRLKGKLVDFAGWEMPLQFDSIINEHNLVRKEAGLFDVSHMGEIEIVGPDAIRFSDYLITNSVSSLKNGAIVYSPMCNENGGIVDDVLVYRIGNGKVMFVVNASNKTKISSGSRKTRVLSTCKLKTHPTTLRRSPFRDLMQRGYYRKYRRSNWRTFPSTISCTAE